jgi:protein-S-isoprenylcysteine O-methyltransferase Ste14
VAPAVYAVLALLLVGAAFLTFRIIMGRDFERRGHLSPISSFLGSMIFFLWGFFTWFDLPPDWPPAHVSTLLRVTAVILMVGGLATTIALIAILGLRRSLGLESNHLREPSLYRKSRNPQVLTCGVMVIGYALLWPSWHTLGWILLYAAIAHIMVLCEEEHLSNAFGEDYGKYRDRVPRYLRLPRFKRSARAR